MSAREFDEEMTPSEEGDQAESREPAAFGDEAFDPGDPDLEDDLDDSDDDGSDDEDPEVDDFEPNEAEVAKLAKEKAEAEAKAAAEAEAARKLEEARPVKGPPSTPDPDAEVSNPDTVIHSRGDLLEALKWAFEAEEGVEPALLERYAEHAEWMLEANRSMNLTAILEPREIAAKHYLDCWRATRLLPLMGRSIVDLGSGAGFPGIPIALAEPHTSVTLVDSTKKRVRFLEDVIEKMELKNVKAFWDRAEEHLARNKVDMVLVRGVSSVRENVRLLRKVRHSHKDLVMLKGPSWSREARAGEREVERLGFRLDTVWEHELPEGMGKRAILVYRAPGGMGE